MQITKTSANNVLRLQIGYKHLHDSFAFNSRTPSNQNTTSLSQALITNELKLSKRTSITPGVQFVNKKIASNDRGDHNVSQAASFLIVNQQLGQSIFVAPSARLEWNERAGWDFIPQFALSYRKNALQLRGSAGKTIRDADFTERFNNYNRSVVSSGQRLGNPELQTERSFSYEGGADYFVSSNLKLSATYFQRYHKRLIDYVLTPYSQVPRKVNLLPNGTYALAKNIAEVNTSGLETDVQFTRQLQNKNALWVALGLIWLDSKSSDSVPSLYLSSHAKFQANFNVNYTAKWFAFSVNGLYKKRQPQLAANSAIAKVSGDYVLLNAKAEAFLLANKLSAFVEVDNLLDRNYTDLLGAQMPGRWLLGGIKISLSK